MHPHLTNLDRSQTNNLSITHMRSRTVHEQPFANKMLLLLNTVLVAPRFVFDSEESFWSGWNALRGALEAGGP